MKVFTEELTGTGRLTAYVQDTSDEMQSAAVRPAMLVLPGGGYRFCSDREAEPIALAYLAHGFNAFVLRYAVGDDHPWTESYADGVAALEWIRDHAEEVGIDPAKVAVVGFSAGGHLAASLAVSAPRRPDAVVLGYAVTLGEFGPRMGKEILDTVSAVTEETSPTFVFSTFSDTVVPIRNSLEFQLALAAHEVPFESHIYLLGPHGISLANSAVASGRTSGVDEGVAQWLPDSVRFLRRVLGDFETAGEAESYEGLVARKVPGLDMPIGRLLADERRDATVQRHLPAELVASLRSEPMAGFLSLRQLASYTSGALTPETLDALDADLAALREA